MTISDRQFSRFVLSGVVFGFLALIVAVSAATWGFVRMQEIGRLVSHAYEVELAVSDFGRLTERAEAARRGFLLSGDPRFADTARQTLEALPDRFAEIVDLAQDPRQDELVKALQAAHLRHLGVVESTLSLGAGQPADALRQAFAGDGGPDIVREVREISGSMAEVERVILDERRSLQEANVTASYVILVVSVILLLAVAGATIWIIRRNLSLIKTSRDTLRDLNDNLEVAVLARTSDLQRANDEIQRFAYIVSHDLRSPLVNVMGFTAELDAAVKPLADLIERVEATAPEMVTEEARLAVREDLPEAIGFIRSSTQKMDRLINAILRLSREGRRVITPEPLDIAEMLEGIVGSLQHRLGELGAEVTVETPMPGLVSDRVAIEQILSNLVENAVKYLKAGRPGRIVIRGRSIGERVVYEVEDNGRGIDPKDHERIFDLFRRSGTQDQPGEGIGLAHVRALAYRLGGMVDLRSKLGEGATFLVSMPKRYKTLKESKA